MKTFPQKNTSLYTHIIFIQKHVKLSDTDPQIRLIKLVTDVPAERTELAPLLNHGVEEAQRKQQLLEVFRLFVAFEPLEVVDRIAVVWTGNVRS